MNPRGGPAKLFHTHQPREFHVIRDNFKSVNDVTKAIKEAGVVKCGLIFGIDYTISNRLQGQKIFGGRSLHDTSGPEMNPYQQVIVILGETLQELDDDGIIPAYGFGDEHTKDKSVFPLKANGKCKDFNEVLNIYNERTPNVQFSGPTNFAPLIAKAVKVVKTTRKAIPHSQDLALVRLCLDYSVNVFDYASKKTEPTEYHILVIVADDQATDEKINTDAIVEASNWTLSIVVIGVGDGPWDAMKEFEDRLPARVFDNFQFVNFHDTVTGAKNPYEALELAALMEIPDRYQGIKDN